MARTLSDLFPDAPIYTSVYHPDLTFPEFKQRDVRTTFLQKVVPSGKFRMAAPLYGYAFSKLDLSEFDTVLVTTSGFAHHIKHPNAHVLCHTPPHFIYDLDEYLSDGWKRKVVETLIPALRIPDQRAAAQHSNYRANSKFAATKIKKAYGKDVQELYCPFQTEHLPADLAPTPTEPRALMVGRLMPYKRFDIAIDACAIANIPLTIVGAGPDESRLRSLAAGSNTTFAGRVSDAELADIWHSHSVALMPGVEDFGFAPLDANYAGRPVIGRNEGGAVETITPGVTGELVKSADAHDWANVIEETLAERWDPVSLRESTRPFQLDAFERNVREWLNA